MLETANNWDVAVFQLLNGSLRADFIDSLCVRAATSSLLWILLLLAPLTLVALYGRKKGGRAFLHAIVFCALAVGVTDFSSNIIKEFTVRPRPKEALPGVYYLDQGQWRQQSRDFVQTKMYGGSMPSSHAANSMAAAVVLSAVAPPLAPIALGASLVSGYSRIYRARHYPSDVLIGWLLGLFMGWITVRFRHAALRYLEARRQKKGSVPVCRGKLGHYRDYFKLGRSQRKRLPGADLGGCRATGP